MSESKTVYDVLTEHHKFIQKHETKNKDFNKRIENLWDETNKNKDDNKRRFRIHSDNIEKQKKKTRNITLHLYIVYGIIGLYLISTLIFN